MSSSFKKSTETRSDLIQMLFLIDHSNYRTVESTIHDVITQVDPLRAIKSSEKDGKSDRNLIISSVAETTNCH